MVVRGDLVRMLAEDADRLMAENHLPGFAI